MLQNLAYHFGLVIGTTFIHAGFTAATLGWIHSLARGHWALRNSVTRATVLAAMVFAMSVAAVLEAALWATAYWWLDALPTFDESLYFSLVTYTTLGYGDITLDGQWRMLAGFQAANGIMIFGWTTALIATAAQRLYFRVPHDENK